MREPLPLRITAYDGSAAGPEDAPYRFHIATERGLNYLMSSPDPDLGMGRAYVSGDLQLFGAHPGDPYDALVVLKDGIKFRRPTPSELVTLVRSLGVSRLVPPAAAAGGGAVARPPGLRGLPAQPDAATPRRSATTTTSPTGSTSWCSARR